MTFSSPNRTKVFISYSHKDTKYLDQLLEHLAYYERSGLIDSWSDKRIMPGLEWREEIRQAIASAKLAVLLISSSFLASRFIAENELPPLLTAAEKEGTTILCVIIRPSNFEDTQLSKFQAVNNPSIPLTRMKSYQKDELWAKVARDIKSIVAPQRYESMPPLYSPTTSTGDVVISYSRSDAFDFAQKLATELKRNKIEVWLDSSEIEGSAEWLMKTEEAITKCRIFLAIRTPGGRNSLWLRSERLYALKAGKPIISILLIDCADDLELVDRKPLDFRYEFGEALSSLLGEIKRLLGDQSHETVDRRTLELAYLGRIQLEYSIWKNLYTPMAGVAQIQVEQINPPAIVTQPTIIDPAFQIFAMKSLNRNVKLLLTERREYSDILIAIEEVRQLVVLGDPGSGKTTTLWRLGIDYATKAEQNVGSPLPVIVQLGELESYQRLDMYIRHQMGDLGQYFPALMNEKRLILLLDGLNELSVADRAEKLTQIKSLIVHCQQEDIMVVATCRELDYQEKLIHLNIENQVIIKPLDPLQIYKFVNAYIEAPVDKGDELFWQLAGGEKLREVWCIWEKAGATFALFWTATDVPHENPDVWNVTTRAQDETWQQAVSNKHSMLTLASNPYMLYMMTQVFVEYGNIPPNRSTLFRIFIDFLLIYREKLSEENAEMLKRLLADLAYGMQAESQGTSFKRSDVLTFLQNEQNLYYAQSANILTGSEEIRFTHQLLQEYFAASKLDEQVMNGTLATNFWPSNCWWEPHGWEETTIR